MNLLLMIAAQSGILILALLLVRKLFMGRINPVLQYSLWGLVALRLFIPVNIKSIFSVFNLAPNIDAHVAPVIYNAVSGEAAGNVPASTVGIAEAINSADPVSDSISTSQIISAVLTAIWIAGMAAVLIYTLIVNIRFCIHIRKNGRKEDGYVVCPGIASPCIAGVFRPVIVLTEGAAADKAMREYSVLHERTHLSHKDNLWALFRTLACVIYWFDPLVWIAASVCRRDQEMACDYSVVKTIGEEKRI